MLATFTLHLTRKRFIPLLHLQQYIVNKAVLYNVYETLNQCHLQCRTSGTLNISVKRLTMNNPARTSTAILENYYVKIANFYRDPSYKIKKTFLKSNNGFWECTISVKWPVTCEFRAEESKKAEAAREASRLILEWLQNQNRISRDGKPLLADEMKTLLRLQIKTDFLESIDKLSQKYEEEVKPYCDEYVKNHEANTHYFNNGEIPSYKNLSVQELEDRDALLYCRLIDMPIPISLPVDEHGNQIVETIETNRVVIIKGATGSGKTTRVPQLILDHYIKNSEGSKCNIVITQPRRISAVSIAAMIARERNEDVGFSVGHHVRFSSCYPSYPGTIMFVSTGILLQRLIIDSTLKDISHVIIDEAHERDLNIDLLLMLMKDLLYKNDTIRVIIMSATINAESFQQYFNNCPLLTIPGFSYHVQTHYVDDKDTSWNSSNYSFDERDIDDNLITDVILRTHRSKPSGAILVFLPGWADITSIQNIIQRDENLTVLIAHSKMKLDQQQLIFDPPPEGKRKVILATNIAESSITIRDVVYVIDSGLMKETGLIRGVKGLSNVWISKAIAEQRKGRAGRIREGECFRLYSERKYESFDEYPVPEILRESLESLVMRIKMYTDEKLLNILRKFPSTPPEKAITDAIKFLREIRVFDENENLTPLGRRIAVFGMHPLLSVALVFSTFFRCYDPMLFTTSYLNGDASLFSVGVKTSDRRTTLCKHHPTNDNVAAYRIYKYWKDNFISGDDISDPNINPRAMEIFKKVLQLNLNNLFKARLVSVDDIVKYDSGTSESVEEDMVAPVLLAATGRLAVNAKPYQVTGKVNNFLCTLDGLNVQVASDSVNFKTSRDSSTFITYYNINTTEEGFLRIYGTAQVSSVMTFLFCPILPEILETTSPDEYKLIYPRVDLPILCRKNDLNQLLYLRKMMWDSLQFFLAHHNSYAGESDLLAKFNKQLNEVLKSLLRDNCHN